MDDTAGPTLPYGSVNSRVFDALAAGRWWCPTTRSGVRSLFGEHSRSPPTRTRSRPSPDRARAGRGRRAPGALRSRCSSATPTPTGRRAPRPSPRVGRRRTATRSWSAHPTGSARRRGATTTSGGGSSALQRRGPSDPRPPPRPMGSRRGPGGRRHPPLRAQRHRPRPSQLNRLWIISHPDRVTPRSATATTSCSPPRTLRGRGRRAQAAWPSCRSTRRPIPSASTRCPVGPPTSCSSSPTRAVSAADRRGPGRRPC